MTPVLDPGKVVTPHQLELIALYASGYSLGEIAGIKFMSHSSTQQALTRAKERVGAKNLTHLCIICLDAGIIRRNGNGYSPVQVEGVRGE